MSNVKEKRNGYQIFSPKQLSRLAACAGILLVFVYHTSRLYNVEDWVVKNAIWYPSVEV